MFLDAFLNLNKCQSEFKFRSNFNMIRIYPGGCLYFTTRKIHPNRGWHSSSQFLRREQHEDQPTNRPTDLVSRNLNRSQTYGTIGRNIKEKMIPLNEEGSNFSSFLRKNEKKTY